MKAFMRDFCKGAFGEEPVSMVAIPINRTPEEALN